MTQISVAGILASKAPGLSRRIPKGIVRWLERTIHQDEINHILRTYDTGDPLEFLRGFFGYIGISYETVGLDELPRDGRYIFASNHPFGGMDGMMLAERIGMHFGGDVRVIVNDILMYLDPLKSIFVPVNKHGAQRGANATAFNEAFAGPMPVLTFPAGLCSRCTKGVVCDLEWRPNFIKRAVQNDRMVVPVHVEGHLSKRFYRLANWRKRLGVKANIEMLFLPDEMFRQKGEHFRLIFGKPVSVEQLRAATGGGGYPAMAQEVKRMSYALAAQAE